MEWILCILTFLAGIQGMFSQDDILYFTLTEESPALTFIGNIVMAAKLEDQYSSEIISTMEFDFQPTPNQDASFFEMDRSSGTIRTSTKKLDRESVCTSQSDTCTVEIDVGIVKPTEYLTFFTARIEVLDINDEAPRFSKGQIEVSFSESSPVGSTVSLPLALDPDSSKFSVKRYELSPGVGANKFEILYDEPSSLKLELKTVLDREEVQSYDFQLWAFDGGNPSKRGSLAVRVLVEDANDHEPVFVSDKYTVNISETFAVNQSIVQVEAQDADSGIFGQIQYSFAPLTQSLFGSMFEVSTETGIVILKEHLDYEKTKTYSLDILATDGGVDSQAAQTTVDINILDVNDNAPQITLGFEAEAEVPESAPIDTFVGVISIFDADSGRNGETICSLNSDKFNFKPMPSNRRKLVTAVLLDREVESEYILTIECRDSGLPPLSSKKEVKVVVLDENDHAPVFSQNSYASSITENSPIGSIILQVNATDRDSGDNAKITYEISAGVISKFITIDESTGVIKAAARLDYESVKELQFDVIAKDSGSPRRSSVAMVTLTILDQNDNAPEFSQARFSFDVTEGTEAGTIVDTLTAVDPDSAAYNKFTYVLQEGQDAKYFNLHPTTGVLTTKEQLDREASPSHHLTVHAADSRDSNLVSTAFVDIIVNDVNDNYPQIHYPTGENNTVRISNSVPIGYTILKVQASDADIGPHANLSYMIMDEPDRAFAIDPRSGILETNKAFYDVDKQEYTFTVLVKDHGEPPKANTTRLTVMVDSAITYAAPNANGVVRQNNLTIIIAVATVSGIVMIALIIAIVLLKTCDHRKEQRPGDKYMVNIEASVVQEGDKEPCKKEVSFVIDPSRRKKQTSKINFIAFCFKILLLLYLIVTE